MAHEKDPYVELDELSTPEEQAKARRLIDEVRELSRQVHAPPHFLARGMAKIRELPPPRSQRLIGGRWLPWILSPAFACLVLLWMLPKISGLRAELEHVQQELVATQKQVENFALISPASIVTIKSSDDLSIQDGKALVCGHKAFNGKNLILSREDRTRIIDINALTDLSCPKIVGEAHESWPLVYINRNDEKKLRPTVKSEKEENTAFAMVVQKQVSNRDK